MKYLKKLNSSAHRSFNIKNLHEISYSKVVLIFVFDRFLIFVLIVQKKPDPAFHAVVQPRWEDEKEEIVVPDMIHTDYGPNR